MKQVFCKIEKFPKKQALINNDIKKDFKTVKEHFKNIDNMKEFLKEGCQDFNNNFELLNFVNSGSCGVVFEGKIKKSQNKRVGLKFLMGKILDEKCKSKKNKRTIFSKKITP